MSDQLSLFDMLEGASPGDTTTDRDRVGRRLTWDEACSKIGQLVWYETIMQSMTYWTAVIPEKRYRKTMTFYRKIGEELIAEKSDRLICFDGTRNRMLIDEHYCSGEYQYPSGSAFCAVRGT